jgi:hypothetical protein
MSAVEAENGIDGGPDTTSKTTMLTAISKTLAFMDSQSTEKQMQKQYFLQVRILRDEIAALTRKSDKLSERYFHSVNKDSSMLEQVDIYEVEISRLESKLKDVQTSEVERRATALLTSSTDVLRVDEDDGTTTLVVETPALQSTSQTNQQVPGESVCIECGITSTMHTCQRCKLYVCSMCCSTHRQLEMIWRCARCFDVQSLTTQNMIRDGNYNSDGENDNGIVDVDH